MEFSHFSHYQDLKHLITEKQPGVGCSFSLAMHTGEDSDTILVNRARLKEYFGEHCHCATLLQTHGDSIYVVAQPKDIGWQSSENPVEADALITDLPNMVLTILTADCVPILLHDPVVGVIGAVHAGWRGTEQGILPKTIQKMTAIYGCKAENILGGIGPAIGGCCYEVGAEVAEHFTSYTDALERNERGKYQLNLKSINHAQLLQVGVEESHIETSPLCTACHSDRFFSYRKEQGCSGRFMSAIAMTTPSL